MRHRDGATDTRVQGVILAAGKASRIHPLNQHTPKPLLSVGNKPIVAHQIEHMRDVGVTDVVVVVGPHRDQIIGSLGDGSALGVRVTYVEQSAPLGIAHALGQAGAAIDAPFFVFLGDIYPVYLPGRGLADVLDAFLAAPCGAVLTVKDEPDADVLRQNFAVRLDGQRVTRVVEKPRRPARCDVRGCGIYLFDPVIFDAIARTPRTALRDEYELTDAIEILLESGEEIRATEIVEWDMNITFPEDLLQCNLHYLAQCGEDALVGAGSALHPGCRVVNSVIGPGVCVRSPITITDSLVLPGACIDHAEDISRALVTPELTIACTRRPALSGGEPRSGGEARSA